MVAKSLTWRDQWPFQCCSIFALLTIHNCSTKNPFIIDWIIPLSVQLEFFLKEICVYRKENIIIVDFTKDCTILACFKYLCRNRINHHEFSFIFFPQYGIDVKAKDSQGQSPIMIARKAGSKGCIDILLQHGGSNDASPTTATPILSRRSSTASLGRTSSRKQVSQHH